MVFPWKAAIIAFVVGIILDYIWIGLVAKNFYMNTMPFLNIKDGKLEVVLWAGAIVYVLIAVGVAAFIIPNNISLGSVALQGALLGLIIYGVYDMTNHATLQQWPIQLLIVDMLWGTFLVSTVSSITYLINNKIS